MRITVILALIAALIAIAPGNTSADTSGDDPSGYSWTDTNAPEPTVAYDWIDISGSADKLVALTDTDDAAQLVPLGFEFEFFGETYSQVVVSSNGFLSFDLTDIGTSQTDHEDCNDNFNWGRDDEDSVGLPIPQPDDECDGTDSGWGSNPLIAVWLDDMDPDECGDVYSETVSPARQGAGRMFIVQWQDVCHNDCEPCEPGNGVTYEVILFEGSNEIKVQYADGFFSNDTSDIAEENFGLSGTTGLDKDAAVGLQYTFDQPVLTEELAVLYEPIVPLVKGDTDCDEDVDSVDALWDLRDLAGLSTDAKCLDEAGNVDCDDDVDSVDALFILRYVAALEVNLPKNCTAIGTPA